MRRLILFLSISLLIYSCNNNSVVIKGKLENPKGSYIYLHELTLNGNGFSDSVLLNNSGSFKFKKELKYPMFYTLQVGKSNDLVTVLAKPGDRIKITGKADNLLQTYYVTGSEESKDVQVLARHLKKTINTLDSLNNIYLQFLNSKNKNIENIRNILSMNYDNCLEEQRKFSISFIKNNPNSLACVMALYQQINSKTYVFDKEDDFKYFIAVDSALFRKYRDAPHILALHTNIEQMKEQKRVLQLQRMLSIMGAKAPELALPSAKGDTVRLSSFKGKVVLIDFWASWNKECLKENTNLVDLYKKYKSKGFEIYQVSLDKSKDDWTKAIKDGGLWWTQVCDFKYWQSPVVSLYNFDKVPTTFLIDKSGTIISRDLKGENLNEKLAELFEEKPSTTGKQVSSSGK
ncbi:MAG TPA: TlpA disulfide reductase family protein [Bacteroidales bacterium]